MDVAIGAVGDTKRHANDVAGHTALVTALAEQTVALIVMEATGGYEAELACALQAAGLPVAVINPRQARDFAKAMGRLAKTDPIDAAMLAELATILVRRPDIMRFVRPLPNAEQTRLAALVARRRQLLSMLTSERLSWPQKLEDKHRIAIEAAAQGVLDARAACPGTTLAQLYDPKHYAAGSS